MVEEEGVVVEEEGVVVEEEGVVVEGEVWWWFGEGDGVVKVLGWGGSGVIL